MSMLRNILRFASAAVALSLSVHASAQLINVDVPKSSVPAENALFSVLARTNLVGTGSNGVPAGITVNYKLSNPGHCAPAIQLWGSGQGSSFVSAISPAVSLRMHDITGLGPVSETQILVLYKDGSRQPIAVNSAVDGTELVNAIQALGAYCLKQPRPEPRHVIIAPPTPAATAPKVTSVPVAPPKFNSKRSAQKMFSAILVAFNNRGSGAYKMSAGMPTDSCVSRLVVHVPMVRLDSSGDVEEAHDDQILVDWSKLGPKLRVKNDGQRTFFNFPESMSTSSHWPMLIYLPPAEAVPFSAAAAYLASTCATMH